MPSVPDVDRKSNRLQHGRGRMTSRSQPISLTTTSSPQVDFIRTLWLNVNGKWLFLCNLNQEEAALVINLVRTRMIIRCHGYVDLPFEQMIAKSSYLGSTSALITKLLHLKSIFNKIYWHGLRENAKRICGYVGCSKTCLNITTLHYVLVGPTIVRRQVVSDMSILQQYVCL